MPELTLFITSFLSATLLPFSSEVAVFIAIENGVSIYNAIFFASFGNVLAIIFNYILGYFLYEKTKAKLLKTKIGRKTYIYGHKWGYFTLLFSFLPIVGDPITIVAGLFRLRFIWFILLAGSLRVFRYIVLTQLY